MNKFAQTLLLALVITAPVATLIPNAQAATAINTHTRNTASHVMAANTDTTTRQRTRVHHRRHKHQNTTAANTRHTTHRS